MMNLLAKEMMASISFYHANQGRLKQTYSGRYLLLCGTTILGDYNSWSEAFRQGYRLLQHENFFIKYCR